MKKILLPLILASALPAVRAGDLSNLGSLSTSEFHAVTEDLGAAFSYKPLLPAASQGITGFDLGVAVTNTGLAQSADALKRAGADLAGDAVQTLRLHAHKGLPLGFDVGGFIASVPALGSAYLGGAELRYAPLRGGLVLPTIGVRAAYTRLSGSDQLALSTRSLDISISKGFVLFTPYAGIGQVWVDSEARGSLGRDSASLGKVYAGLQMGLGLGTLALEMDQTGKSSTWGAKLSMHW